MASLKTSSSKAKRRRAAHLRKVAAGTTTYDAALDKVLRRIRASSGDGDGDLPGVWIAMADQRATGTLKTKFGQVVVANAAPDAETVSRNVAAGQRALRRATEVLVKPGVKLELSADVPRFSADSREPGLLVRELKGAIQRGRIVAGTFVPIE